MNAPVGRCSSQPTTRPSPVSSRGEAMRPHTTGRHARLLHHSVSPLLTHSLSPSLPLPHLLTPSSPPSLIPPLPHPPTPSLPPRLRVAVCDPEEFPVDDGAVHVSAVEWMKRRMHARKGGREGEGRGRGEEAETVDATEHPNVCTWMYTGVRIHGAQAALPRTEGSPMCS
eukprot:GHVU01052451.1.p1 GENE.GHVU01052451.1~~GHVU01052451.1.p1  ORF type:complete len:170 (+),score=12.65 GHVU01052451.1:755-1264(+)